MRLAVPCRRCVREVIVLAVAVVIAAAGFVTGDVAVRVLDRLKAGAGVCRKQRSTLQDDGARDDPPSVAWRTTALLF